MLKSLKTYLDTNIFCEAFEGHSDIATQLKTLFEKAKQKPGRFVTSEFTLAELLGTEPPDFDLEYQTNFYMNLIVFSGFIEIKAVTRDVLIKTGGFRRDARRAGRRVNLADAIHAVTAIEAGCQVLLTSDKRFPVPETIRILPADELGIALVKTSLDV